MKHFSVLTLSILVLPLAGCQHLPASPQAAPVAPATAVVVTPVAQAAPPEPPACPEADMAPDLLDYFARMRAATTAEQGRELQQVQAQLQSASAPRGRLLVQLAMLAALGRPVSDPGRLIQQLDALQKSTDPQERGVRPLASLLHYLLLEQRRAEDHYEKSAQALREEQRRREALEEREAALLEKLEGLKAIERNLMTRPQVKKP